MRLSPRSKRIQHVRASAPPFLTRRELITAGALTGAALLAGRAHGAQELPLITKSIPSSGEKLPVIGLGTNNFSVSAPADIATRREVLEHMPQLGGTVVDTARIYGQSEAVIGELVASIGNRERLFLATKVLANSADAGKASLEESFRLLKTARMDLLQVHNLAGVDAMVPVLQEWKKAGKVRYVGITTASPGDHSRMVQYMRQYPLDFIQVDYSIGNRGAAQEVLPLAQERRIAVLVNVPFGGRRGGNVFTQVQGRTLPAWAADIDVQSWGQFFLKYVVSHPAVTCAIPGTTELQHLEDNQRAGHGRLPDAAMRRRMEEFWDGKA
jgi:aryl-alcohol dehydrogenase-like predicted oxidoreductase